MSMTLAASATLRINALPAARAAKGVIVYDIVSVLFVLVFFALCVAYTHACDWILGPDEQAEASSPSGDGSSPAEEAVAA